MIYLLIIEEQCIGKLLQSLPFQCGLGVMMYRFHPYRRLFMQIFQCVLKGSIYHKALNN